MRASLADQEPGPGERRAADQASGRYPAPVTAGRGRNMQAIRRVGTKPELALRSALHRKGYRFRKDHRIRVGDSWTRPDIVFTRRNVAIFVDGCFWHCCPEHGRQPTSNEWYWSPKLARNVERDRRNDANLAAAGWTVLRIWEHEAVDDAVAAAVGLLGTT